MTVTKLAIPNKGRMATAIQALLRDAGYPTDNRDQRGLLASIGDDIEALFVRAADIPAFVDEGVADAGITGLDLVQESGRNLCMPLDLNIGACRLVIAAEDRSDVRSTTDIQPGTRVATSFPRLTREFFDQHHVGVEIIPVSGAAEIMPYLGVADLIVDLTATGATLRTNGLHEVATIMRSTACAVTRTETSPEIDRLVAALDSVVRARRQRYVMANVPKSAIADVQRIAPGMNGPTVTDILGDDERVAVHAVVNQDEITTTLAQLKEIGAEAVLVTRIERLVP